MREFGNGGRSSGNSFSGPRRSHGGRNRRYGSSSSSSSTSNNSYTSSRSSYGGQRSSFGNSSRRGGSSFRRGGRGGRSFGRRAQPAKNPEARYIAAAQPITEVKAYIPTFKYADLDVNPTLRRNILKKGYENPSPIQDQSIPHALKGKDILGIANTGTGKTAAFLIPLLQKVIDDKSKKVIIITPTRELAEQINDELYSLTADLRIFSVKCIGGDNIFRQIQNIRRGFNFIIGTPGRLQDLIERKVLDISRFDSIVLDEVDRMLDMGFVDEIKFLIKMLPEEKQSLFFSATMDRKIEGLIQLILKPDYVKVAVSQGEASKNIHQDIVYFEDTKDKLDKLKGLIKDHSPERILIFANTKREVDKIDEILYNERLAVDSIHGDKRQSARKQALTKFKTGRANVLIATDVAARGLDIPDVKLVINYDEPNNHEDYIHRIGRTGRAGKIGKALTFIRR